MKSKITIFSFLFFLILLSLSQPAIGANNSTQGQDTGFEGRKVDSITYLRDYSYEDGAFILYIESELVQPITLSDVLAGTVSSSSFTHIPQEKIRLDKGMNQIRFEVTEYRGSAIVGIGTSRSAASLSVQSGAGLPFQELSWDLVFVSGVSGAAAVLSLYVGIYAVLRYKEPKEPNEVL